MPRVSQNAQIDEYYKSTKEKLAERPKKTVLIPLDPLNPKDTHAVVGVNGYIYRIKRGEPVEVPDVVADIWNESYAKTLAAQNRIVLQENPSMLA